MTKPKGGDPSRVALETAFLSSGLPEDVCIPPARAMAAAVVGVEQEELESLAGSGKKLSTRDLPLAAARGEDGGTTVSATRRVEDVEEAAAVGREARAPGLSGAILVCIPPPPEHALSRGESDHAVAHALEEAGRLGIAGSELTPFLLARVAEITEGVAVAGSR